VTDLKQTDSVVEELARLPRARASSRFAEDVLAALDSRSNVYQRSTGRALGATAVALILAALVSVGYGYHRQRAADLAYERQVEELRTRYQELLDEVASVRQEAVRPEPRLYLGGDEGLDLVLDLGQTPSYSDSGQDARDIRPANWEQ